MAKNYSKKFIEEAIKGSGGITYAVSKRLGCDFKTADKFIKKYGLEEEMRLEREVLIDLAEGEMIKKVRAGDTQMIMYFLNNQAKHRGYNRQNISLDISQAPKIIMPGDEL